MSWKELEKSFSKVGAGLELQKESIELLVRELLEVRKKSRETILLGVGRCASILNLFATRLVQPIVFAWGQERMLNRAQVKLVSEDSFISVIEPEALVICLSGTGKTFPLVRYAENYKSMGAKLVAICSVQESKLVNMASFHIILPGISEKDLAKSEFAYGPDQPIHFEDTHPGPTFFECNAILLLESVFSSLKTQIELEHSTQMKGTS